MSDESPDGKKKGHGAGARERRLRALPHWDDIEVRLQHSWSPDRVIDWYRRSYPGERAPARMILYRYLGDKPDSWYVPDLVIEQTGMKRVPQRILVLEKQAGLIQTQMLRLNKALALEGNMDGLLIPEIRANIELLDRLLHRHHTTQQDAGLEPKVTQGGKGEDDADDRDGAVARELSTLVHRLVELPTDQYLETLVAMLGPPPIKQPLQIGGMVIEKKPLGPDGTAPGGP